MFAREWLPKIGYKKRLHLMNSLIPGLSKTGKMASSEPLSKVDFDDSDETIKHKISHAYSIDGKVEGNGLLALLKHILFHRLEAQKRALIIHREAKFGGDLIYNNYEETEKDFECQKLVSADLKNAIADELISLITPLRQAIQENIELMNKAYPVIEEKDSTKTVAPTTTASIGSLDIRVGKITKLEKHPNSETLYIFHINVGELQDRKIVSSLSKSLVLQDHLNLLVLFLFNLPPKDIRGVSSHGLILSTSISQSNQFEFIDVPAPSLIGEKLLFDVQEKPDPILTDKRLKRILSSTFTDSTGLVVYKKADKSIPFKTSAGHCSSKLKDANVI